MLCCLKYENYLYTDKKKNSTCSHNKERQLVPKPGMMVATPTGDGRVMAINRSQQTAAVELAPGNTITVGWDEMVEASKVEK